MFIKFFKVLFLIIILLIGSNFYIFSDEFDFGFLNDDSSISEETITPYIPSTYQLDFILEQSLRLNSKNSDLSDIPMDFFYYWNNRLTLLTRFQRKLYNNFMINFYSRFNYIINNNDSNLNGLTNNDINELYLTWNINNLNTFEIGRINIKNGVALGFNPVDFLKKYAGNEEVSDDPVVLRENRLGVLMARYQNINKYGSFSLLGIPKINSSQDKWYTTGGTFSLNLDKTNRTEKYIAKIEFNTFDNIQPELFYILDDSQSGYGASISSGVGNRMIIYAEWSGKKMHNILMETILKYCIDNNISTDEPKNLLPDYIVAQKFRNQVAAGFSWTEKKYKRTTYVEYHYNENGLKNMVSIENIMNSDYYNTAKIYFDDIDIYIPYYYLYWATRDNANNIVEPYFRHQLFLRNHWYEAFTNKLNIISMFQYNINDKSFYSKFQFDYNYNSSLTLTTSGVFYLGGKETEYGSLPELYNLRSGLNYFF